MAERQEKYGENDLLNKRLDEITKRNQKEKSEDRRIRMQIEEEITKTQVNMAASL